MAYTRYFAIKNGITHAARDIETGATELTCVLKGREKGGLCDTAEATIPANFPNDYGISKGDFFVCGYDSSQSNQWWHGIVTRIEKGGPGSTSIRVEAVGIEWQLKYINPRINFGIDPANPYVQYDNPYLTGIDTIVAKLWNNYIKSNLPGVALSQDIDTSDASTDITYLEFDGSANLYDILNSLAERTGMSWGFDPTTASLSDHTFFFKSRVTTWYPNQHKFVYGTNCISISVVDSMDRVVNGINLVHAQVPKLGVKFSRRYTDSSSRTALGPRGITKTVPGIRTTADSKIHAAAILYRQRDPDPAYQVECLIHDLYTMGAPIYPGRTRIKITNQYGTVYNQETEQQYSNEINVDFIGKTIQLSFTLGEEVENVSDLLGNKITAKSATTPKQSHDYDASTETWTEDGDYRDKTDRVQVVSTLGVIETEPSGDDNVADVRLVADSTGGDDLDAYRELYQDIPVPLGLGVDDWVDVKHWFEDDELQEITAEVPGAGEVGTESVGMTLEEIRYALATGTLPIYNTTVVKDIEDYAPTGTDDANIAVGGGAALEARLGLLARIPEAGKIALNTLVYSVASASYNTPAIVFPSADPTKALLFGRVLDITDDGHVALGTPSGDVVIVNVKTGATSTLAMYLKAATDPTYGSVVSPLGAITRGNS